jgi:drug/metabolite transporter (DMT)-like permease
MIGCAEWPHIFLPKISSRKCVGEFQIVLATISFACAFVGQRWAMVKTDGQLGPVTFNAARYVASLAFLFVLRPILRKYAIMDERHATAEDELYMTRNGGNRSLIYWVTVAGISNFGGSMLQQYSLVYLDAAKVAFITGSYVVLIPFVEVSEECYSCW